MRTLFKMRGVNEKSRVPLCPLFSWLVVFPFSHLVCSVLNFATSKSSESKTFVCLSFVKILFVCFLCVRCATWFPKALFRVPRTMASHFAKQNPLFLAFYQKNICALCVFFVCFVLLKLFPFSAFDCSEVRNHSLKAKPHKDLPLKRNATQRC
jgi:hypothetical protein